MTLTLINVSGEHPAVLGTLRTVDGQVQADASVANLLRHPAGVPRTVMFTEGDAFLLALANQYALGTHILAVLEDDEETQ
jgi:hypothetical protein